jgi:hypothetical protein
MVPVERVVRDRGSYFQHQVGAPRRPALTDAGDRQEQLRDVMRQSRHVKVETALGYMEDAEIWQNNITAGVFAR